MGIIDNHNLTGPDKWEKSRDDEVWSLGPNNYLDAKGERTKAKKLWVTPALCKKAQELPEVRYRQ